MYKLTWTVGALFRRQIRRELQRNGIAFTEDKGFLDSQFVVRTDSKAKYIALKAWMDKMAAQMNAS
jgi:hypothetical protein